LRPARLVGCVICARHRWQQVSKQSMQGIGRTVGTVPKGKNVNNALDDGCIRSATRRKPPAPLGWFMAFVALGLLCSCPHMNSGLPPPLRMPVLEAQTPVTGNYHKVQPGETLQGIAAKYRIDARYLAEINNLNPPYMLHKNGEVFIPTVSDQDPTDDIPANETGSHKVQDPSDGLLWPVEGRVVAEFGVKKGVQHNGISIEAAEGAPVMAVQDGKVGHVGSIPGYGNVILIEHPNRLVSVYAHLKEMKVPAGTAVKQGSIIATVGSTGRASEPQLYFEIRSKSKPRNPLFFLKKKS